MVTDLPWERQGLETPTDGETFLLPIGNPLYLGFPTGSRNLRLKISIFNPVEITGTKDPSLVPVDNNN
jgi:hypothetical protein